MTALIVVRPEPGCTATLAAAQARGIAAAGFPMFRVVARAWLPPDANSVDALLIGSANALRHGGPALAAFADKPVYAVGETTAQMARTLGLKVIATGAGGLADIIAGIRPEHRRLLRLAGERRVPVDLPAHVSLITRIAYASEALPMPDALRRMLDGPACVALHSAEAARHFAAECDARQVARAPVRLLALGPRIAQAAGTGWAGVAVAERPTDTALLALAERLCQGLAN